jgi:hypothetical protein
MTRLTPYAIAAALLIYLAYCGVEALEKSEFYDQAQGGARYEAIQDQIYNRELPAWFRAGRDVTSGMGFDQRKKERGR